MRKSEILIGIEGLDVEALKNSLPATLEKVNVEKRATRWDCNHPAIGLSLSVNTHDGRIISSRGEFAESFSQNNLDLGVFIDFFLWAFKDHLWNNAEQVVLIQAMKTHSMMPEGVLMHVIKMEDNAVSEEVGEA